MLLHQTMIGNRYHLEEKIGQGGMATVYRGIDQQTGKRVAVKHFNNAFDFPEIVERFKREGEALRALNHPNIVKMIDMFEEAKNHYLVLEYVGGGDLTTLIRRDALSVNAILEIALELADALTRAHQLKIIHRDIKPANVLIAEDGTSRLTDFGIVHLANKARLTEVNGFVGTLDYLPPETLNGKAPDHRVDIWALGALLFEMMAKRPPFKADTVTGVLDNILIGELPDLEVLCPDAPPALVDLIYRMLERERSIRIPSMRHVGAALEDILHGRSVSRFESAFPKHNLPVYGPPFVGREEELEQVHDLLVDPQVNLITLVAPGGTGKTRLALEAARQHIDHFADGVFFVPLAPLLDMQHIVRTVAEAVGFPKRDQKQALLQHLSSKRMLLVIDHYDHLMMGAGFVSELLAQDIKILVTSRQPLKQRGEVACTLTGLKFGDTSAKSAPVKLFVQCARRIQPQFDLTPENLNFVVYICQLLQGMPLAIMQAAWWLSHRSLREIAAELRQNVKADADLTRIVTGISWGMLDEIERMVINKLTMFRGGFTRESAGYVARSNLRLLTSLANKSLIQRDAASGRYIIHDSIRQFAHQS